MKHLLRPCHLSDLRLTLATFAVTAALIAVASPAIQGQVLELAPIVDDSSTLLSHSSDAGYLGVDVADVDADKAQALKLKDVRGAVITLIDHDAPAGQVGLKPNDVVLAIDGQTVEGSEALRRILREIPPGRKISLEISRDGNIQTLAVQLVDRKEMEKAVWNKINLDADGIAPPPAPGMGVLSGGGSAPVSGGFHMSLFTSTLNVGALVEPLTSQMSEYLGVQGGLMVKQVGKKSEAAAAGLKAFDVILKVGADSIATSADWDRALRANVGKPVQVTILRDKKQQTLTLQVDSKHRGAVEYQDFFGPGSEMIVADAAPFFDSDLAEALSAQTDVEAQAAVDAAREQAEQLYGQVEKLDQDVQIFQFTPDQLEQLPRIEGLGQGMQIFNFDPQQMQQLQPQMELFGKPFNQDQMKQLQQQIEKFRQQMQQQDSGCHHFV